MTNIPEDKEDQLLEDYLKSPQFQLDFQKQVEKDTWDIGLPKVYLRDGWLIKEWKDGTKHKVKL